jgi:hypothetical protein
MLDTRFPSPEARAKYWVQWITATNRHNEIVVLGHCVRSNKETLFQHESKEVCQKVCEMLNEGDNKC